MVSSKTGNDGDLIGDRTRGDTSGVVDFFTRQVLAARVPGA